MRRIDFLIKQCRRATDNTDKNAVNDYEILQYFNDAQSAIQGIVFSNNPDADVFTKSLFCNLTSGQLTVDLPSDIYAQNAVKDVFSVESLTNNIILPINRVTAREVYSSFGYYLEGKTLRLTTNIRSNAVANLMIRYEAEIPNLSLKLATVTNIAGQIVTVSTDILDNFPTFFEEDEMFSVVDAVGTQTAKNLRLLNPADGVVALEFDGDVSTIVVGNSLCLGANSTTHPVLMNNTETFLLAYVNRMLFGRNSESDLTPQNVFTVSEEERIIEIYSDNVKDSISPPSTDTDYLGY